MIKTEQLRYLLELDKTNSFHKCAENLFLSQPAISLSIRNLEKELGVTLFERTPAGVFPTEIGKKVIAQARTVMHSLNDIYVICDNHQLDSGIIQLEQLNIYAMESFTSNIMPSVLPNLQKQFPKTKFSFQEHCFHDALEYISASPYSIGFHYIWNDEQETLQKQYPNLQIDTLHAVQFMLMSSKNCEFPLPETISLTNPYTENPIPLVSFNKSVQITAETQQLLLDKNIIQVLLEAPVISLIHAYIYQGVAAGICVSLGPDKPVTSIDRNRITFTPIKTERKASLVLFTNRNMPEEIHLMLLHHLHSYLNFM